MGERQRPLPSNHQRAGSRLVNGPYQTLSLGPATRLVGGPLWTLPPTPARVLSIADVAAMASSASSSSLKRLARSTSGLVPNTRLCPRHHTLITTARLPWPGSLQFAPTLQQALTPCAAISATLRPTCAVDSDFDTSSCTCPLAGK